MFEKRDPVVHEALFAAYWEVICLCVKPLQPSVCL